MMDHTFVQSYTIGQVLSFDEGCCPFKGGGSETGWGEAKNYEMYATTFGANSFCDIILQG